MLRMCSLLQRLNTQYRSNKNVNVLQNSIELFDINICMSMTIGPLIVNKYTCITITNDNLKLNFNNVYVKTTLGKFMFIYINVCYTII